MPEANPLPLRRCKICDTIEAGKRIFCSKCGGDVLEPTLVDSRGIVTSWTIVRRPATAFQHLGTIPVVMVTLQDGTIVTGRFQGGEDRLQVGQMVSLSHEDRGVPHFSAT